MLYLISLLSFLLPTQLGLHFNNFDSTVYGFRIDYLIPTLYLTDIVALLIIILGLRNIIFSSTFNFTKKHYLLIAAYFGFAILNISNSLLIIPALYKWLKVTEMILLGVVINKTKTFDVFKNFIRPLSYSVFIICLLGIAQFINNESIGGLFYLLGERTFMFNDPNIAPYPYSTFSHPNSFAGFLLVFSIFLLEYRKKFVTKHFWTLLILVGINLVLTNSLNVYIATTLILLMKYINIKTFAPLVFVDLSARYITHRIELIKSALTIIKENFWFGVGFNNFVPNLVKVSNTFVNAWELQPVHNIFLLIFSETGIIGFIVFMFLIFSSISLSNYPLIAVVLTGLNDHYWITLQQNILLLVFVLALSKRLQKY
ncbi:MAG: O-antigen ligase family protein [Microgenomates group bacterium]